MSLKKLPTGIHTMNIILGGSIKATKVRIEEIDNQIKEIQC